MSEISLLNAKRPDSKKDNSIAQKKGNLNHFTNSLADRVLYLQRTAGNQAVQRLFRSGALQAKLRIGQPGDKYEQEADRVADTVMRIPEPQVQRQPMEEKEEEKIQAKLVNEQIQRQVEKEEEEVQVKATSNNVAEVNPDLESQIQSLKGSGKPLSENDRAFFEPHFGCDFSQVRLHTDAKAAEMARGVNARAFAVGKDVMFGAGEYAPDTLKGNQLIAHELTHVMQQGRTETTRLENNRISRQQAQPPQVVQIVINRQNETNQATIGDLTVGAHNLRTLELPNRNNSATNNSQTAGRIPAGTYHAHVRTDGARGWRLELENVPGRTNIQIHVGNTPQDTVGCILPGMTSGQNVVNNSVNARNLIQQEIQNAPPGSTIEVTINDPPAQAQQP